MILLLFLLFSLSTCSEDLDINMYNISLEILLNIINIKNISEYIFNYKCG